MHIYMVTGDTQISRWTILFMCFFSLKASGYIKIYILSANAVSLSVPLERESSQGSGMVRKKVYVQ